MENFVDRHVLLKLGVRSREDDQNPHYPILAWDPKGTRLGVLYWEEGKIKFFIYDVARRVKINKQEIQGFDQIQDMKFMLNENTLLICMIESRAALENVEEIAAVPGVDILHIGSNDLSSDMGIVGELTHPQVKAAFERVVAACHKHGKIPGIGGLAGADTKNYDYAIKLGARFMSAGNEWAMMIAAGKERVKSIRSLHSV